MVIKASKGNKQDITTIKIEKETKQRLSRLKEYDRETYNQVIKKILYVLNRIRKDPISANRHLGKIDNNIKRKQVYLKEEKDNSIEKPKPIENNKKD